MGPDLRTRVVSTLSVGAGFVVLMLCLPPAAGAVATGTCGTPTATAMTITVTTTTAALISTAGDAVTIDGGMPISCPGLDQIFITGDAASNTVNYSGSGAWIVQANLAAGTDTFTATGSQPVDVNGGGGTDTLTGGDGADNLSGGAMADILSGGAGADRLAGNAGLDDVSGGADDDTIVDDELPNDTLDGGDGASDTVTYVGSPTAVIVDLSGVAPSTDTLSGFENATGGAAADTLTGNAAANVLSGANGDDTVQGGGGTDTLNGGGGNDQLIGGPGVDTIDGGADDDTLRPGAGAGSNTGGENGPVGDTLSYEDLVAPTAAQADLAAATALVAGETQALASVEHVRGGPGDDALTGDGAANTIDGAGGNDNLTGGAGGDRLLGGADADTLDGGADLDGFDGAAGDDRIAAVDGVAEDIICGAGNDRADHDATDTFSANDCELRIPSVFVPPPIVPVPEVPVTPIDADQDGVPVPADCNDGDARIRPGVAEIAGNAIDENCDRIVAPFPRLASKFRWRFVPTTNGTAIQLLLVSDVPAAALIELRCRSTRPRGCAFSRRSLNVAKATKRVSVLGYFRNRRLPPGTRVDVRVSVAGTIGRMLTFTTRKHPRKPKIKRSCLPPGATRGQAC